jgi:cytochrome P450
MDGPTGNHDTEEADHRRMRMLSDHVQHLADTCVDRLITERAAAPDRVVDLHAGPAFPLPVAVICRLLGVPESDREHFASLSERMSDYAIGDAAHRARDEFHEYMTSLAETKRARPGEDVISDLVRAQSTDEDYDYADMIQLCVGLLFAGHETTVNPIGLGTLSLLTRPGQWQALTADPAGRVDATVEEIMRLGTPGD